MPFKKKPSHAQSDIDRQTIFVSPYQRLFETANDGILILDAETGKITDVNPFLVELLGYSKEQFIEKTIWELGLFRDIVANRDKFSELQQKEYVRYENLPLETADSRKINVEFVSNVYLLDNHKVIQCNIRNITDRVRAEKSLKISEIRYRRLFETAQDGILILDAETGKITDVNPFLIKLLGYSKELFIEKAIWELGFFRDIVANRQKFSELQQKEYVRYENLPLETSDGRKINVEFVSNVYLLENHKVIQCNIRNITDRVRAEQLLKVSEIRYRRLFETAKDGILILDAETGMIIDVNQFLIHLLGYSKEQFIEKKIWEIGLFKDVVANRDNFARLQQKEYIRYENLPLETSDGQKIHVEFVSNVYLVENQKVIQCNIRDITQRRLAELALNDSEALMHTLVKTIPDLIWLKDTKGVYLTCNPMFGRFFGAPVNSIIGKTDYDYVGHDLADFFLVNDRYAMAEGKPTSNEEWVTFADDGHRACLDTIKAPMYDSGGGLIGVLGIGRDITERKQAQVNLREKNELIEAQNVQYVQINKVLVVQNEVIEKRAAELIIANKELAFQNQEKEKRSAELIIAKDKAEESDRLKTAFLANMSHEIRTPMNGILGFSELLKEPNLTGEEQQKYIRVIEKSGARMLNIINDIVSISKVESGLMEISVSETNINKQIEDIYTLFKPEAEQKGLRLGYHNSLHENDAIISSDNEKIYAILTNLVKNAIKFCDTGNIEFGYHLKNSFMEFYVKDTGIGIPKARQQAIFDRFVQADIADKRAFQGAGLGLSISKAYVEMLGGKIWVESEEGSGSVFHFTIPYHVKRVEKTINGNVSGFAAINHFPKLKILIVEDDETSEMLINMMVEPFSREVLIAGTGLEAIEICRNNPDIDMILMDIKMPVMDGYTATRQIRQFNKKVIIIAQTAFGLTGDREDALEAGCNDYLSKPFNKSSLTALMTKYVNLGKS
jgi:PAS domain S-box-containing protein